MDRDDAQKSGTAAGQITAGETGRIERRTLHDEVVSRLRTMIVEGELAAGERIPERILCERFGISRTPLREALKVLATEGLIDLLPNRGAVVSRLDAENLRQAFEVMGALEALAGELACRRMEERDLEAVRRLHRQMLDHYRDGRLNDYFGVNLEIHERLLAASGNAVLADLYNKLRGQVLRARFAANLSEARWRQAVEEHEEMMTALEARDSEGLGRILKRHLANKCESVLSVLEEFTG